MTQTQAKHLAQRVADLFPGQLNKGTKAELVRRFTDLPANLVERSIGTYFQEQAKRLKLPELFEAIESAKTQTITDRARTLRQNWCDVHRQQNPKDFAKANDHEVILRVHWRWWSKSPKSDADRRGLLASCAARLIADVHLTAEAAEVDAALIFGDERTLAIRINELRGNLVPTGVQ